MRKLLLLLSLLTLAGCKTGGDHDESTSGMDKEAIRRTIRSHVKEISACYEPALEKKPDLAGKLVMQWDVIEKGKVQNVRVVKPFETSVDDCVAERIENWTFETEPPKGQVGRIVFPFLFSSKDAEEKKP